MKLENLHAAALAAVLKEHLDHITAMAKCVECGATRALCDALRGANTDPSAPSWFGCCTTGVSNGRPCRHVKDDRMLSGLLQEVASGTVRTVAEAYPAPVLGPRTVDMGWLLDQKTWWYPHKRPALLIASMDKPHRYNAARWLERRASSLHNTVGSRWMSGAPDEVWAEWQSDAADPVRWLRTVPLMRALRKGLPTSGRKLADLQERAKHWSTCPMRLKVEERPQSAACTCTPRPAADGGRPVRDLDGAGEEWRIG